MTKIAVIDKQPNNTKYDRYFELDSSYEIDVFHLSSTRVKRLLKKDVTLEVNTDDYDYVVLVGSDALKHFTKLSAITTYSGHLVQEKFIPVIDPSMLVFKPEATSLWENSVANLRKYVSGEVLVDDTGDYEGIEDEERAIEALTVVLNAKEEVVALDSETSALHVRDGYMLGISLSYKEHQGYYISSDALGLEALYILQEIVDNKHIVMHNKKFDMAWYQYHLDTRFGRSVDDTMIMHYVLNEQPGTHGLKQLCIKYTDLGDYDRDLDNFKKDYCKAHSLKQEDFSYSLIPFDIMGSYAAKDTAGTLALYNKFQPIIYRSPNLRKAYADLLNPACDFLLKVEQNGVPFDLDRLHKARDYLTIKLQELKEKLYTYDEVSAFEKLQEKVFNPQSPVQLRKLMFDFLGLKPTGKLTGTGAASTDVEVLTMLSKEHEIPALILSIRQTQKLLNTYISKILPGLDRDSRLRTNFNLVFTTSGRLSSSGKLNMQQLPRDNPIIKGCIKARPGYMIVAMDLGTAEMYYAAILSGDIALMKIFQDGGDFHSAVAKMVFHLDCPVEEVKSKYPTWRQAAKAISFGILYGSGATKVAHTVNEFALKDSIENGTKYIPYGIGQATSDIELYFETYPQLKKWIEKSQKLIKADGFIYSFFGRKRRLPNVFSQDGQISSAEVRSGLNFLIQSVASDVNLLGAMDAQAAIEESEYDIRIFALVHDSILAEVPIYLTEDYQDLLLECVQKDRGLTIPGAPIPCDFDIHEDYSLGKYEKAYPELV